MIHEFVISGIGLVLNEEEAEAFVKKAGIEIDDLYCDYKSEIGIDHDLNVFDVENMSLYTINDENKRFNDFEVVFYAFKALKIVGAAYETKEEVVNEFKEDIGRFLPEDFDYEGHIGLFEGVLYE